ncbi:MAG: serine protease [Myxococcaceae bacterium]|nr:serine protease [Myxococcaceae bacterium]
MDVCPSCGEADSGDASCARCGGSLLVDVVVEFSPDERVRFNAAKAVSALGPPAPAFAGAKSIFSRPGTPIVRGASRAFARRIAEALQPLRLKLQTRPAETVPSRAPVAALAFVVLVAVAGGTGFFLRGRRPAPVDTPTPAPQATAAAPAPKLDRKKVQAAVVQLSCRDQLGSGFFIEPTRVLTNAHVVCADDAPVKVSLPDGRSLLGKVVRRDDWLDYAVIEVSGADNAALPLGDSTSLAEGDPIVLVGSPHGLSFTWHEGKVSYLGRNHLGIAYVQLDATVNPGNSGGPLVNARGEVVGIVSMKVTTAEGIGLALPVEYVEPPEGEALDRWNRLLKRVAGENEKAVADATAAFDRPSVVGVEPNEHGIVVTLVLRAEGMAAPTQNFDVDLIAGDWECRDVLPLDRWVSIEDAMPEHLKKSEQKRELDWMLRAKTFKDVKAAVGLVPFERCDLKSLKSNPELVLVDGMPGRDRREVQRAWLSRIRPQVHVEGYGERVDSRLRDAWRTNFLSARSRVESARDELDAARAAADTSATRPGEAAARVKNAEDRLRAAEASLANLERTAASQGVPLEWRR